MSNLKSTTKANTKAIFEHAYTTMMMLKSKSIEVDEAKAQSNLIKQANNVLKYELDRAVAHQKYENLEIRNVETD